jgi:hypothetical protein
MPRFCSTLISLLAVLTAANGLAQTAQEFGIQTPLATGQAAQVPLGTGQAPLTPLATAQPAHVPLWIDQPVQMPLALDPSAQQVPLQTADPPVGELRLSDEPINLEGPPDAPPGTHIGDFLGYRYATSSLNWIPGDQLGMFSVVSDHYEKAGFKTGIGTGMSFHFLDGPKPTDMPPRLFDFSIAFQMREHLGPLAFDVAASVMASSDFEGSARKGIRFPGHAVGYLSVAPTTRLVFGVDFLDREDIHLLPVAGLTWTPSPRMGFEFVFPRPRAVFQLTDSHRLYVSGELGGGSWAIWRPSLGNDMATYRDLRACIGVESVHEEGIRWAFEIGYLFDRHLEYSSGLGDMPLDDAIMLRLVTAF